MTFSTLRSLSVRAPRLLGRWFAPLAACAALSACGHGQYTQGHLDSASEKVALMKSGTEWNAAQQQFLAGELDKALKSVDASLQINNKVAKSHLLKGRILLEKGELEGARASFLETEKIDPKNADANYYLGILHERFAEPQAALERYSKASSLAPSNPQYLVAAAEMLIQLDRLDDSLALLDSRAGDFQYNAAVRQTRGHIASLKGDHAAAVKIFAEARLLAPDDASILEDLARTQVAAGQFGDAEYNIAKLLDMKDRKDRRDLKHLRAMCLLKVDRPTDARDVLIELTTGKEGESDVQAWISLGNVAVLLNDSVRLKQSANRIIGLAPENFEGYLLRATLLRRANELEPALAAAETAKSKTKTDPAPYILAALINQDLGRADAARENLTAAAAIDPNNPGVQRMLGRAVAQ